MYSPNAQFTWVVINPIPLTPISFLFQREALSPTSESMFSSSCGIFWKEPVAECIWSPLTLKVCDDTPSV